METHREMETHGEMLTCLLSCQTSSRATCESHAPGGGGSAHRERSDGKPPELRASPERGRACRRLAEIPRQAERAAAAKAAGAPGSPDSDDTRFGGPRAHN